MTSYHGWRIPAFIFFFHLPLFFGMTWTLSREFNILFWFLLYANIEDYLWFFFHPSYGPRGFVREGRAGKIWWMPKFFGWFPKDYYLAIPVLLVLKVLAILAA